MQPADVVESGSGSNIIEFQSNLEGLTKIGPFETKNGVLVILVKLILVIYT
ncbi:MAG: hypothetical protein ACI4DK_06580 [Lachnospiraceae bacterium]